MTAGSSSKKMKGNKPKAMKPRKVKAKGTDTDGTSADVRSHPHGTVWTACASALPPAHHACGLYCGDSGGASGTALHDADPLVATTPPPWDGVLQLPSAVADVCHTC